MPRNQPQFALRVASTAADVLAAQALRYRVFVVEGGADGPSVDHERRIEADRFDAYCGHLLLTDVAQGDVPVATCRLLSDRAATRAGGFASEEEFDIGALRGSGRRVLEVGRTCLHPAYRGGTALHRLWQGLAAVVARRRVEVLFGLASFPGTAPGSHAEALAWLHHDYLAPADVRPRSRGPAAGLLPSERVDRRAAALATPALVKAYLRLGGRVGEGAFVDHHFRCTDVCLVLEAEALASAGRRLRAGPAA